MSTEKLEKEVEALDREAQEALDRLADKREELERERERNRPEERFIFPRKLRRPWK
jgi:prefoldin subunit 5